MNKSNETSKKQNRRFLVIFICVFLSIVLIFGAVLGTVLIVRNSRAYVKYKSARMESGALAFFESYYKSQYIRYLRSKGIEEADDIPSFWESTDETGKTYGEGLIAGTQNYISEIMAANYLFDSYSGLDSADKDIIENAARQKLEYIAEGDKNIFNEEAEYYGFDYSSYKTAVKMIYKAAYAQEVIYGSGGSKLKSYPELAGEYLDEYSHVKLLFIRTENTFVLDAAGNRVTGNDGNDATRPLTDTEKTERAALISEIRSYIAAIGTENAQMGETMFNTYLENKDEGDRNMHGDGYYFHKDSDFSAEFSEEFKSIVDKSYEMSIGSFDEVTLDFGVCFIYKYAPTEGAYLLESNEVCFGDFYSDASDMLFSKTLRELVPNVTYTDKYSEFDVLYRPYTSIYFPAF